MRALPYEEEPIGDLFDYKLYFSTFVSWALLLFSVGTILGFALAETGRLENDKVFLLICGALAILGIGLLPCATLLFGVVENTRILVTRNNLILESPLGRKIPIEEILKIVFDGVGERIIVHLKRGRKICLKRRMGNLFDMVKGTREEDLRIAPLLKALKEAGIKYEIIWRDM